MTPRGNPINHEFDHWEPARPMSDEDHARVRRLQDTLSQDHQLRDELLAELEGELVPVCVCGWRVHPEPWERPSFRSNRGGMQQIQHRHNEAIEWSTRLFAADMAVAALRHAAEGWPGDPGVADWLRERADRIHAVGQYDGENWPA